MIVLSLIGVDPEKSFQYENAIDKEKGLFHCLDGSKTIPLSRFNDNYIDCPDGSDEPGTSASPESFFYCENKGSVPIIIKRWSVGDGLCDCCDGSDEPELQCPNTCAAEEGERQELLNILYPEMKLGLEKHFSMQEQGKNDVVEAKNQLSAIQEQLDSIDKQLKFLEDESNWPAPTPTPIANPESDLDPLSPPVLQKPISGSQTLYAETRESFRDFITDIWNFTFKVHKAQKRKESKLESNSKPKPPPEIQKKIDDARSEQNVLKDKKRNFEKLSQFNESLDYAYAMIMNEEYKYSPYKVRVLDDVKQDYTNTGRFRYIADDKIFFDGGSHCWQTNSNRKTVINLICWNETKLVKVLETSMCEYTGYLATPIACTQEKIDLLKNKTLKDLSDLRDQMWIEANQK